MLDEHVGVPNEYHHSPYGTPFGIERVLQAASRRLREPYSFTAPLDIE